SWAGIFQASRGSCCSILAAPAPTAMSAMPSPTRALKDLRSPERARHYTMLAWQADKFAAVRLLCFLLLAVFAHGATAEADSHQLQDEFDCADAFDLVAMMVIFRCAAYQPPPGAQDKIAAALDRLHAIRAGPKPNETKLQISFCPLASGTGMVPTPTQL